MKNQTREVLLMTRTAQQWQDDFEEKIAELMEIIGKVDTKEQFKLTTETMNVYHETPDTTNALKRTKIAARKRPFQFTAFMN